MSTLVSNRSLSKLYEIGNTKSFNKCQPRPVKGVSVSRIDFTADTYRRPVSRPVNGHNNGYNQGYNYNYYGQRDQEQRPPK